MSLVGKKAPAFKAPAVINGEEIIEGFTLEQYLGKNEVVLFFYPRDFTYVCPTEIHAFQDILKEFKKRGVEVVGASTDTEETHLAWLMVPKAQGGIQGITFPLIADNSKTIAISFGILGGEYHYEPDGKLGFTGTPNALRATFLIDKLGIIRHEYINYYPLGRNIEETLRMVDAWQHYERKGEVCPANWEEGQEGLNATREGVSNYLSKHG
ncbi:MAG TPA: peroxiredoxin [Cyclobacteriaceae bacterium]|nr:peroxiredoxin [Cyclobacteriaceae bacterium]